MDRFNLKTYQEISTSPEELFTSPPGGLCRILNCNFKIMIVSVCKVYKGKPWDTDDLDLFALKIPVHRGLAYINYQCQWNPENKTIETYEHP